MHLSIIPFMDLTLVSPPRAKGVSTKNKRSQPERVTPFVRWNRCYWLQRLTMKAVHVVPESVWKTFGLYVIIENEVDYGANF